MFGAPGTRIGSATISSVISSSTALAWCCPRLRSYPMAKHWNMWRSGNASREGLPRSCAIFQTAINRAPMPELDLDTQVKLAIYEIIAATGSVPTSSQVSRKMKIDENEVLAAFQRLHAK